MPRLSVIVPVYNVEAYLPACIDSILKQTIDDLEVILIDDGSPDRCGKICDTYAERDRRIKVIHQSNHGVSNARNAGLRISRGDYIGFVDPDDLVDPEMFEAMMNAAEAEGAQIAICGFAYCSEDGEPVRTEPVPKGVVSQRELILSIYGMPNIYHGSMCNKIFSREALKDLSYDESVAVGEDWLLLYDCYEHSEKAVALQECYYTVRIRSGSATRKASAELYMKKLETYSRLYRCSLRKDKEIRRKATAKILDAFTANKEAIIREDYDRKCLSRLNRRKRRIAVTAFLRGDLSFKRMVFHVIRG
ncbi:MAG: glycosyltransferase [Clostridiales bacterium]|nr:glycosyltransferase [Clostridiales bacterium]